MPDRPRDLRAHRPRAAAAAGAALTLAVIALGGCGGGGSTSSTTTSVGAPPGTASKGTTASTGTTSTGGPGAGQVGQRLTVREVVDAVLTSADPATACGDLYVTPHYLSVAYGDRQGCVKAQTPGSAAQSLKFSPMARSSSESLRTSVKVVPSGGVYDGEKLTVSLVHENGTWKVDALKSNAPVGP